MLTEAQFRAIIVKEALSHVGADYRDSAIPTNYPPQQFDCSVFTHWCASKAGIDIDLGRLDSSWPQHEPTPWRKYRGYTGDQMATARRLGSTVTWGAAKAGDFAYYEGSQGRHVVVLLGDDKVVHAAGTAFGVIVSKAVPPNTRGHGGKTLVLVSSPTKMARALGMEFARNPAPPSRHIKHLLHLARKHPEQLTRHQKHVLHVWRTTGRATP